MSTVLDRLKPEWHPVVAIRPENSDTITLTIETDHEFTPGQFDMITVFGVGEVPISHSGHPRVGGVHEHTIRKVGAITKALAELQPGDLVGSRGPYGHGWPMEEIKGSDVVIVAGGIGLAPLRPVVLAVEADPGHYGRVVLLVGARSPSELQFTADMERWKASSAVDVYVTVDRPDESWDGPVGVVTQQLRPAGIDPDKSIALLCGPEIMMRFAASDLLKIGVPAERIYVSLERNMECGIGLCGHCVIGDRYVCWGGPVVPWSVAADLLKVAEL